MPPSPGLSLRLAGFYAAFFGVIGIQQPFWPVWLEAKGLTAGEIGTVLAAGVGVKVLSSPVVAHVADRSGERRRLILSLAALSLGAFALFGFADGFPAIIAVSLLFYALWPPIMPLAESVTMLAAGAGRVEYGRIRLWGSLGFIVLALVAGRILATATAAVVFWMTLAGITATFAASAALPDIRSEPGESSRLPIARVLQMPSFTLFLLANGLIQGSHAVYYAFGTLHWRSVGYSDATIGALWAEGVIAEIILFAFGAGVARRLRPTSLIALAGIAGAARWVGLAITDALPALIGLQTLHAFSFGAAHLAAMHYLGGEVSPGLSATAQSLYSGVVWGLFLGGMLYLAGFLYGALGPGAYLPMAVAAAVGGGVAASLPGLIERRR